MSVVIVGGNERMVCQYMDICKNHGCKAKVYVKENGSLKKKLGTPAHIYYKFEGNNTSGSHKLGSLKKKLGTPDYLLLFTSTVSHKMMLSASKEAKRNNIPIAYVPSSSASALHSVLADCCAAVRGECAFNA